MVCPFFGRSNERIYGWGMKITAVIVAAGSGRRMGAAENKVFLPLRGKSVLSYTIEAFERCAQVQDIILVTRECDIPLCRTLTTPKVRCIVAGGSERRQSVLFGLRAAQGDIVLIHDGARPFIEEKTIRAVIDDCIRYGGAAVGVPCKDTLKTVDENGMITGTVNRERTYQIQTPQAFYLQDILAVHEKAEREKLAVTDDCALLEQCGRTIKVTEGSYENVKLTTPEDMAIGERILQRRRL